MDDKCITLCADYLCLHNSCSGYYGVCALSALSEGTYTGGIDRTYVNTCPKKEPIPRCIVRGPGKIAVFAHGDAGNGKSTLDLERTFEIMTSSAGEPKTFTVDEVMSSIQYAMEQFKAVPKPEITPWSTSPFQYDAKFTWDRKEEEGE